MTIGLLCLTLQPCKLVHGLVRLQGSLWRLVAPFFDVRFDSVISRGLEALWLQVHVIIRRQSDQRIQLTWSTYMSLISYSFVIGVVGLSIVFLLTSLT